MKTRDNTYGLLRELRDRLERRVRLRRLVLFGSRARGDFSSDSDMDVVVIVDELDDVTEQAIHDCTWELGLEEGVVIVPVVYSRDEWENGPERSSLLALAVEREGMPA
jgi:predicted nucleotidyltransferase